MKVLGLMGNSTASRTIFLDGESGDEMSESDDGAGTVVDGPASLPRKTKKKRRYKQKTVPAAAGEEHDEDDGYEPSIREEGPDEEDARIDEVPGQNEDGDDDDDDRIPAADDDPEVDQPDEDEVGVENGPHEEEDDEDDPDGGVRLSKRGTLKHEARTLEHLLTHRYKNPYCNSFVRAKMKHHKTYRGAFRRKLTKFGDLITFDFMDTRKTTKLGYDTVKEILVIRDRFTGIIQSYPFPTKNAEDVVRAVKYFMEGGPSEKPTQIKLDSLSRAWKHSRFLLMMPCREDHLRTPLPSATTSSSLQQLLHAYLRPDYQHVSGSLPYDVYVIYSMWNLVKMM